MRAYLCVTFLPFVVYCREKFLDLELKFIRFQENELKVIPCLDS